MYQSVKRVFSVVRTQSVPVYELECLSVRGARFDTRAKLFQRVNVGILTSLYICVFIGCVELIMYISCLAHLPIYRIADLLRLIRGRVVFVNVYALGVCTSASGLWHFLVYKHLAIYMKRLRLWFGADSTAVPALRTFLYSLLLG